LGALPLSFEERPDGAYPLDRLDPPVADGDALEDNPAQFFTSRR
jgi:hypothetical protein